MLTVQSQEEIINQPSVQFNRTSIQNQEKSMKIMKEMMIRFKADLQRQQESIKYYQQETSSLFSKDDLLFNLQLELTKMFGCQQDVYEQTIANLSKIDTLYDQFHQNISKIQKDIKDYDMKQEKLDHYNKKLDKLKKKGDTNKITRNEQKYYKTMHEYESEREEFNNQLKNVLTLNIKVVPETLKTFVVNYMEIHEKLTKNISYIDKDVFLYQLYEVNNKMLRQYSDQT